MNKFKDLLERGRNLFFTRKEKYPNAKEWDHHKVKVCCQLLECAILQIRTEVSRNISRENEPSRDISRENFGINMEVFSKSMELITLIESNIDVFLLALETKHTERLVNNLEQQLIHSFEQNDNLKKYLEHFRKEQKRILKSK